METVPSYPRIIQGGMGMFVSGPPLARAVAMCGQQGTVSGVHLEGAMAYMLQSGDPGGHMRRALENFPFPSVAKEVWDAFYVEGGVQEGQPWKPTPVFTVNPSQLLISLTICANFAFVWLATEGHNGRVGINYLEKIAMPHIYAITGAMLAGVDFITMGAGIPLYIPDVIDAIFEWRTASYRVPVISTDADDHVVMSFNPSEFFVGNPPPMKKPGFIPIIASNVLARKLAEKLQGRIFGFVVEEPTAGGHNAPPRGEMRFNELGEPLYGPRDIVDYKKLTELGIPFWIGGSYASPERLALAISLGAKGIQVGSIFALCEESEIKPESKEKLRQLGFLRKLDVRTTMFSPTGYPFEVVFLEGTLSEQGVFEGRPRVCNPCALVVLYRKPDGSIGYRCPSEHPDRYLVKGGALEDMAGKRCLCNGLLATVGLNANPEEPPIITLGKEVSFLPHLMANENGSYTASDAIRYLLGSN